MNNRLEELMYESGLTASGCWDSMDDYDHKAIEKLCDLVVRECIEQSLKVSYRNDDMGAIIANSIKKHFGVKE